MELGYKSRIKEAVSKYLEEVKRYVALLCEQEKSKFYDRLQHKSYSREFCSAEDKQGKGADYFPELYTMKLGHTK